jgi:hypothetical protein
MKLVQIKLILIYYHLRKKEKHFKFRNVHIIKT